MKKIFLVLMVIICFSISNAAEVDYGLEGGVLVQKGEKTEFAYSLAIDGNVSIPVVKNDLIEISGLYSDKFMRDGEDFTVVRVLPLWSTTLYQTQDTSFQVVGYFGTGYWQNFISNENDVKARCDVVRVGARWKIINMALCAENVEVEGPNIRYFYVRFFTLF